MGLPFLVLAAILLFQSGVSSLAKEGPVLTFQEFESSCIDLGHYNAKSKQLTVRFVNRNTERFYRYSNVPAAIWKKLNALNETGGVGEYLNETVVQHPEKFPYEELTIRKFKTIPKKKKRPETRNESPAFFERLAATYSRGSYTTTTIGKAAFDGRVRNGNGSDHSFMTTKVLADGHCRFATSAADLAAVTVMT